MFTGLVSDIGAVSERTAESDGATFWLRCGYAIDSLELGESIAVDGACLTVAELDDEGRFAVEASPETLARTTLGDRQVGDAVHLERALAVGERLGGHFVTGHVDGIGELRDRRRDENAWLLDFEAPDAVARYLVEKGSITVDGVSLTVNEVDGAHFGVAIIPHTAEQTNLADYRPGRRVNLEADLIGKYVDKLVEPHGRNVPRE